MGNDIYSRRNKIILTQITVKARLASHFAGTNLCSYVPTSEPKFRTQVARGQPIPAALTAKLDLPKQYVQPLQPPQSNLLSLTTEPIGRAVLYNSILSGTVCSTNPNPK